MKLRWWKHTPAKPTSEAKRHLKAARRRRPEVERIAEELSHNEFRELFEATLRGLRGKA